MVVAAVSAVHHDARGAVDREIDGGGIAQAAIMAITPTKDSSSIAPYPMNRAWLRAESSRRVPEEISE